MSREKPTAIHKIASALNQPDSESEKNISCSSNQSSLSCPPPQKSDMKQNQPRSTNPAADSTPVDLQDSASETICMDTDEDIYVETNTAVQHQQSVSANSDQEKNITVIESAEHDKSKPSVSTAQSADELPIQLKTEQSQGSLTALLPRRNYSYGNHGDLPVFGEPPHEAHSYLYYTIVAAIVVGLCLDFVVLLAVFVPALWLANKV